jgi:hypothetical protein
VDSKYGPINNLFLFKNRLMYFQDNAFGVLSVNDRSLVQDSLVGALTLGTGDVLDRYDYMSDTVGNKHKFGIVSSPNSVYWFHDLEKSMYKFSGSETPISKLKGMQSWFEDNYDFTANVGESVYAVYDSKYNEVIFTFGEADTIAYNELIDGFSSFYSFTPGAYVKLSNDEYLSLRDNVSNVFYHHNNETVDRCEFYGTTYTSDVKFLVNPNYSENKVFDTLQWTSDAWNSTKSTSQYNYTFQTLNVVNDYQNTDDVTLTFDTNLRRRERVWSTPIPRNQVDSDMSVEPDLFTDIPNTAALFKDRMRGTHVYVTLGLDNSVDAYFNCPFVKTLFRKSYR